jgi:hypothetical protein
MVFQLGKVAQPRFFPGKNDFSQKRRNLCSGTIQACHRYLQITGLPKSLPESPYFPLWYPAPTLEREPHAGF